MYCCCCSSCYSNHSDQIVAGRLLQLGSYPNITIGKLGTTNQFSHEFTSCSRQRLVWSIQAESHFPSVQNTKVDINVCQFDKQFEQTFSSKKRLEEEQVWGGGAAPIKNIPDSSRGSAVAAGRCCWAGRGADTGLTGAVSLVTD